MAAGDAGLIEVRHEDTFRCPKCGLERRVEVVRSAAGAGDDEAEARRVAGEAVARMAQSDLGLVACPRCKKRPRLAFLMTMTFGTAMPALAVGLTSLMLGRWVVGAIGTLFGVVVVWFGVNAPRSSDRAVRFLDPG